MLTKVHVRSIYLALLSIMAASVCTASQGIEEFTLPFSGIAAVSSDGNVFATTTNGAQAKNNANLFIHNYRSGKDSAARILNDFPNVDSVQTWSVAATSDEVTIAVVLVSSATDKTKTFRDLILHYALDASLKTVAETTPYMCHDIAEDASGNVYCYGAYTDKDSKNDSFLIHRYNAAGLLSGQYLNANRLPPASNALYANGKTGSNFIQVDGLGHIAVWVAPARNLLLIDETSLKVVGTSLEQMEAGENVGSSPYILHVGGLFFSPEGSVAMHVVSGSASHQSPKADLHSRLLKIAPSSGVLLTSKEVPGTVGWLSGYKGGGNLIRYRQGSSAGARIMDTIDERSLVDSDGKLSSLIHAFTLR